MASIMPAAPQQSTIYRCQDAAVGATEQDVAHAHAHKRSVARAAAHGAAGVRARVRGAARSCRTARTRGTGGGLTAAFPYPVLPVAPGAE